MPPAQPSASNTREALPATPASRKRPASTSSSLAGLPVAASKASRRGPSPTKPTIKTVQQDDGDEASQSMDETSELMDNVVQYSDMGADDEEPCSSSSLLRTPSTSAARPKPDRRRTGRDMSVESDGSDHTIIGSPKRKTFYTINDLHSNKPAERFRTDILTQIRAADSEYTPSSDEGSLVLRLTDRWREEWSHGVQVLLHPKNIPRFETRPCDIPAHSTGPFRLPAKYLQSKVASYQQADTHVVYPPPYLRIYQGDRLDELWLERLNREHVANRLTGLDLSTMLNLMNEFEIECFQNIHRAVLTSLASPSSSLNTADGVDEDAPCDVCLIKEDDDDQMIFCDGCNKCVHLTCYGYVDVPEGHWECDMCRAVGFTRHDRLKCRLCPNSGGMMKPVQNNTDNWVHLSCAMWIPEIKFGVDKSKNEVVLGLETVLDQRWQLKCSICDLRHGACIQCDYRGCAVSFHTTCAQRSGVCEVFHEKNEKDEVTFMAYCKRHTLQRKIEKEGKRGGRSKEMIEQSDDETDERSEQLRGLERAFFLHVKFEDAAKKLGVIPMLASDVYEYWKQKRAENGGRPLIACPQTEIEVDTETPILTLESGSGEDGSIMLRASDDVQASLTPFQLKCWRYHRGVFQPMDRGRLGCDLVVKREKRKLGLLENSREIFNKLIELDSQPGIPMSQRSLDQLLAALQKDLTPEEIAESERIAEEMVAWKPPSSSTTTSPTKAAGVVRKRSSGGVPSAVAAAAAAAARLSPPATTAGSGQPTPRISTGRISIGMVGAVATRATPSRVTSARTPSAARAATLLTPPTAARHASPTKENGVGARGERREGGGGRAEAAAAAAEAASPTKSALRKTSSARRNNVSFATPAPRTPPPANMAPPTSAPASLRLSPSKTLTRTPTRTPVKTPSKRLRPQNPPDDPPPAAETPSKLRERREVKYSK